MKNVFEKTIVEYFDAPSNIQFSLVRVISFDKNISCHFKLIAKYFGLDCLCDNPPENIIVRQTFWNWFFYGDTCRRVLNLIMDNDFNVSSRSFTKITYRGVNND